MLGESYFDDIELEKQEKKVKKSKTGNKKAKK